MKVAVSIPDKLFEDAEMLSRRLGLSRSRLYADALEEIVAKHNGREITDRLNLVYAEEDSSLPHDLRRLRDRSIEREPW
jgi:metal-responsive CopG/Arc/MetJ family transcriptional regulator